jgi:hypothetical protein
VFHERHSAPHRPQVGRWLNVGGALAVALLHGAPAGASDHQSPAASRPDFSGEWVLESASPSSPDNPRTLSVRQFQLEKSTRDGSAKVTFPSITIERTVETDPVTETHQIGVIGGTVGGIGRDGRQSGPFTSHAVKWDGDALVFENESHTERVEPTTWSERREVWSVDEGGRLRIVISNRSSDGSAGLQTLLYRRR